MANNKNQHFVPQVYLRSFASDKKQKQLNIWLHKQDLLIFGASIKNQCSKSYFYGSDLILEELFKFPEQVYGKVKRKIINGENISNNDLYLLLFFWLVQYLRSERAVESRTLAMDVMRDKILLGHEDDEKILEYVGAPMTQEQSAKMALAGASNFIDIISDLKCALLINKSKLPLITSDNPAVESNRFILQKYKGLKNWGLSTAGIYLYLPISPKYAFIAYDKCVYKLSGKVGRICDINQADVFILNQLIFLNSDNSIYFHNNEFTDKLVAGLKEVSGLRQDSEFRVNVAVLTENNESKEYQTFVAVTDEEFMNAGEGLLHIESRPPKINKHFSKLRYQYKLRYVDTRSGAGLRRYTVDQDALRRNRY